MELKYEINNDYGRGLLGSNRTFMELKSSLVDSSNLLIAF